MREYKKVIKEEFIIDSVFCNCCGKEINIVHPESGENYLSVDKLWGYGCSLDGERHSFDLCEDCYKNIIAKFKISPLREN